jgi:UDP-glucose 4-epimerase
LVIPKVHADDVADAIARELDAEVGGAVNLAAEPPITAHRIADALGARPVHIPSSLLQPVMSAAWHARLQQVDTGWLDMDSQCRCSTVPELVESSAGPHR